MDISASSFVRRLVFLTTAAFVALSGSMAPLWGQPTLIHQSIPALNIPVGTGAQTVNLTNYIQNPNAAGTVVRIAVGTLSPTANTIAPTSMVALGNIDIALTDSLTPKTVANFLAYINSGAFVDNIIHRSVPGFIIQGGGFNFSVINNQPQAGAVATLAPIPFEQGLSNVAGTIAMAQVGSDQNSATSQWFINLDDNSSNLDFQNGGFCAFGTVLGSGMAVANEIAALPIDDLSSISSAWNTIPLGANFKTGGTALITNFIFTNISQIPALTFAVSSANPSLITVSLSGNTLTVTPVGSAIGNTTITVTSTDTEGATFQTTFGVNVTNTAQPTVVAVAGGSNFSLFLKSDGSLWAMGNNSDGQLGDGTNANQSSPEEILPSGVTAIAAGSVSSLFIKSDGSLWGMGYNGDGELGDTTTTNQSLPEEIVTSGVTAIAAGAGHSLFVKSDGSLWAMGVNSSGQLGDNTTTNQLAPEEIETSGVTTVAAGAAFSLFLESGGSLWAMGGNGDGQLGDGTTTNHLVPEEIETSGVTAISAGAAFSLFLENGGSLWGMGFNDGQLGTNNVGFQTTPEQIQPIGVSAIAAGDEFSLYIGSGNSLWAMGQNGSGQFGNGATLPALTPQQIETGGVTTIAAGGDFSFFIDLAGDLWAMGNNTDGQLGDGTPVGKLLPEQISPPTLITFSQQPTASVVAAGQTATFSVSGSGAQPISYQWQVSTNNGSTWSNLTDNGGFSGVSTTTMTFSGATVKESGEEFRALVINPAGSVASNAATLNVKAVATVTLSNLTQTYTGATRAVTVATNPSGLTVTVTYNGSTTAPTASGNYAVVATATGSSAIGSATGTLVINKATASVSISNTNQAYNGSARGVTVTTNPAGLSVNVTYNGSTTLPTSGGSYAVAATVVDANRTGSATSTLTISKAAQTISFGALAVEKLGNAQFALGATASSGLTVTYTSSTPAVATISNGVVTMVGKGTTTITASQSGNADFNAAGNVSQTLTVNQTPAFTAQPANKTVTAGQTATFAVAASGLPTPTYQWQRAASGTSTFVNLANGGSYSGVTTATLSVSNTTVAMTGDQFQCVVTNGAGVTMSNPAALTVNKAAATVTLSNLTQTYTGTPRPITVATNPSGLAFNLTYNGSATAPTIPGSYAVVATVTDANHSGSASGTLVINKSTAKVTLTNLSQLYNGDPKSVTVTTSPVGLTNSVTYNGSTLVPVNGGSYAVVATITDPFSSGTATGTLTITKATQTITFGALAAQKVGNAPFALTATASSGLAVTYTSSSPTVATVGSGTVTLIGKGTTTITASQAGNANFNAASTVNQTLLVNQTPVFTTQPANKTVTAGQAASFAVAATGLPTPTYQWQRAASGTSTFVNLANGGSYSGATTATLSVSNTTVAMTGDQFQCVATNGAGTTASNPAALTVNKAVATVTLSNLTQTYTGTPRPITVATNPSGLAFNLTYNGSATAPTIPGSYAVVATVTDANHSGSVTGTLVINKSTAKVTLANLSQLYNGDPKAVTVTTSPVGLTNSVTYNGSTLPPVNGGSYAVVATITDPFSSGTATGTLTITKGAQTISFGALAVQKVGDAAFVLTATASSGLNVTYASSNAAVATVSGNTVTIVGKGTATITASQTGNSNYNAAANMTQTLTVNQVPAFTTQPANKTVTSGQSASFTVAATGLPTPTYQWQRAAVGTSTFVPLGNGGSYSGVNTATLSVSGATVAMSGDQFLCVATNVAGNATSNPAALSVNKASATVTLSNLTQTYTGGARTATVATNPGGLTFNITYNGSTTPPINAGSYTVSATITDANHSGSATGTLVINKATATVTLSNLSQTYDGTPKSVTVTSTPTGLSGNLTYNGSTTPPTNAGNYPVVATVVDPNYTGTAKGTLTIGKAAQIISFGTFSPVLTGIGSFELTATATSGLTVTYTTSNSAVATVSNGIVTVVGKVGNVTITASQSGNANYNAAANVAQVLTVQAEQTGGDVGGSVTIGSGGPPVVVSPSLVTPSITSSNSTADGTVAITSSIGNDTSSATWISVLDPGSTETLSGPTAADLPTLLLEAMNLTPSSPASLLPASAVTQVDGVSYLTLQYRQSKDLGSLSFVAQYSPDDVNWIAVPAGDLTQLPDADVNTEQWSASIAVPGFGPIYLRLQVSQSP